MDPAPHARSRHKGISAAGLRFVLGGLSVGGVIAAAGLWAAGHPGRGVQVLAGDVLVMFVLLLIA